MRTASRSSRPARSSGTSIATATATWTPRPGARLLHAAAALLCVATASATEIEERIAACAAAGSPDARIACLESSLRELGGALPAAEETPSPADAPIVAQSPQTPDAPANDAAEPMPSAAKSPPPAAQEPSAAAANEAAAAAPRQAPAPEAVAGTAAGLGAEQVEARQRSGDEETPRVRATAVDFRFVGYRRLLVQLDNGQVWQQIDGDREDVERGLRNTDRFEVEMWATKLGGYRMRILPLERTIRVQRLQ